MINPAHRVRLEDELIRFFSDTHKASGAFNKPKDPMTRFVSLPARRRGAKEPDWEAEADIDITTLAEAIMDGRIRMERT